MLLKIQALGSITVLVLDLFDILFEIGRYPVVSICANISYFITSSVQSSLVSLYVC